MILKNYEINKINQNINHFILFYGKNEGLKNETLDILIKNKNNILNYDEKEILDNENNFIESILSKSLFELEKIVVIKRTTDKILNIIQNLQLKKLDEVTIILNSENLDKKSKLRTFFEKDKELICIPFYPDNEQTLSKLAYNFLKNKNIAISQANINLIINKCNGDREALLNELNKIEHYVKKGKKISSDEIIKLTNLNENHSVLELVDNCLAKNKKRIIDILNENNFNNEDCIMITRSFLNKSKKILQLSTEFEKNKNIELTISTAKPPIFWKDKEITKKQVRQWKPENIKKLIYRLNEIELLIKKNLNISVNLITDFILEQSALKVNN